MANAGVADTGVADTAMPHASAPEHSDGRGPVFDEEQWSALTGAGALAATLGETGPSHSLRVDRVRQSFATANRQAQDNFESDMATLSLLMRNGLAGLSETRASATLNPAAAQKLETEFSKALEAAVAALECGGR